MINPSAIRDLLLPGLWGTTQGYPGIEADIQVDFETCSLLVMAHKLGGSSRPLGFLITKSEMVDDIILEKFPRLLKELLEIISKGEIISPLPK